jgi:hypothetical protein
LFQLLEVGYLEIIQKESFEVIKNEFGGLNEQERSIS